MKNFHIFFHSDFTAQRHDLFSCVVVFVPFSTFQFLLLFFSHPLPLAGKEFNVHQSKILAIFIWFLWLSVFFLNVYESFKSSGWEMNDGRKICEKLLRKRRKTIFFICRVSSIVESPQTNDRAVENGNGMLKTILFSVALDCLFIAMKKRIKTTSQLRQSAGGKSRSIYRLCSSFSPTMDAMKPAKDEQQPKVL